MSILWKNPIRHLGIPEKAHCKSRKYDADRGIHPPVMFRITYHTPTIPLVNILLEKLHRLHQMSLLSQQTYCR
jgi:hypothetical protein